VLRLLPAVAVAAAPTHVVAAFARFVASQLRFYASDADTHVTKHAFVTVWSSSVGPAVLELCERLLDDNDAGWLHHLRSGQIAAANGHPAPFGRTPLKLALRHARDDLLVRGLTVDAVDRVTSGVACTARSALHFVETIGDVADTTAGHLGRHVSFSDAVSVVPTIVGDAHLPHRQTAYEAAMRTIRSEMTSIGEFAGLNLSLVGDMRDMLADGMRKTWVAPPTSTAGSDAAPEYPLPTTPLQCVTTHAEIVSHVTLCLVARAAVASLRREWAELNATVDVPQTDVLDYIRSAPRPCNHDKASTLQRDATRHGGGDAARDGRSRSVVQRCKLRVSAA